MERKIFIPIYLSSTVAGILIGISSFKSTSLVLAILAGIGLGELLGIFFSVLVMILSELLHKN